MTETTDNIKELTLSLGLIQLLSDVKPTEPQEKIVEYLKTTGIPTKLEDEDSLALYIYLHHMMVPFYPFLSQSEENAGKTLMTLLKENYYLLSDIEVKHFNYIDLAEKSLSSLKQSADDGNANLKISLKSESPSSKGHFEINKTIIQLGINSKGRLDIYVKAHIIKNIILFSGREELNAFTQIFQLMEDDLTKLYETAKKEKFGEERYLETVKLFANGELRDKWKSKIATFKKMLTVYQNVNDESSIKYLERLFIQLLGHFEREVRNESVKVLNMIYDETNWQDKSPFSLDNTKIKLLNEEWSLEIVIRKQDYVEQGIILVVNSPCQNELVQANEVSWLKCQNENLSDEEVVRMIYPLGTLNKCGYYDWYLMKFQNGRFSNIKMVNQKTKEMEEGKGRVIVYDQDIKDLSVHEVFCDLIKAEIDKNQGRITKRGTFSTLEEKLDEYSLRYINCLYIMGALERDNQIAYDEETGEPIDIANSEASPMAITCRSCISSLLGGDPAFKSLMNKAKKLSMKVILDSLARISSSRANRKYKNILLHYLDQNGKIQICYGTDGHSVHYEDSAVLNYRKVEAWDLLIQEILELVDKYKIDGVHLDNCQAWPQIMEIDAAEIYRIDTDGKPAYSPMEILNGEIVIPNEESGYWNTDMCDTYANPMLIKLTKEIWKKYPSFVFFGECWLNEKFSTRHCSLAKSGIIPRMYTLPIIISEIFGRKIQRNGQIEKTQNGDVKILKEWYEENYKNLPEGALLVQSSSGQVWPYPALLYGRGNWSAVDILFSLPDIPMTFMNEIDGEAYRVQIVNVYESKESKNSSSSTSLSSASTKITTRSKSLMRLIESKQQEQREQSSKKNSESSTQLSSKEYMPQYNLSSSISSLITLSGLDVSQAKDIKAKQEKLVKELGPEFGFDLNKIKFHYDHRRKMRYLHESLRRGKLIYLNALNNENKPHSGVFAFARQTQDETGIFAINFSDHETNFLLDLSNLISGENNGDDLQPNFNSICYIEDWISEERGDYFFMRELIEGHVNRKIGAYSTICFGFQIIPFTQDNYKRTMEKSNSRMINEIKSNSGNTLDNYQITLQLKEILTKNLPLEEFGKWFNYLLDILAKYNTSFYDYINKVSFIRNNDKYSTSFFKYCFKIQSVKNYLLGSSKLPVEAEKILSQNVLGPICFVTPELGRWSTVGGLGVMVDELSQGLNTLGQDVIMISPYYDRNRKGVTGYLEHDEFNIKYIRNITVNLDGQYTFGVHYGTGNGGIKYYFLHNYKIFPKPYPDFSAADTLRQISLMGKASLELLCNLGIVPAVIVTNDWFTGLTAGYARNNCFGETFKGTTFFHICHNLEPTYEGRLYPSPQEGTLDNIHQLPTHWLVDPYWKQKVINPSRCALMISDQWGTVSNSYKQDLLNGSPLAPILRAKPQPFGFPNGIFKVKRLQALHDKAGSDRKECKKYIQTKYFGYKEADYSVPVYSFVGRITQQKGVLLILDCVEELVRKTNGKINILVGGMGNPKDPYCAACINKINYLRSRYSYAFWADPYEFFTDGPRVNLGSDFGLMPSLFEPGGIVQQEFFIAGTPVIAFRTGGLKDTVFEYEWINNKGNGITFDTYNCHELISAVERSINLFHNKEKYEQCRKNAYESAIDVADVSRAWCREFYRLRGKIFFNVKEVYESKNEPSQQIMSNNSINELKGIASNQSNDYIFKKQEMETLIQNQKQRRNNPLFNPGATSVIIDGEMRIPITFTYNCDENKKPSSVQICGSYDKWQVRHPLSYDPIKSQWTVTLKIKRGKYFYKYIVDGQWMINPREQTFKESNGIVNNMVTL